MSGLNLRNLSRAMRAHDQIITPVLTPWLIQHGDDPYPEWVADKIRNILITPPRDRTGSFSGSSAGGCMRAQELQYLGIPASPTDAQLQNIFNDGKWRHLRWQAMLLAAGILLDIEFALPWVAMHSMGSADGIGIVPDTHPRRVWRGKDYVFELKGISTFQFGKVKDEGVLPKHLKQVHRYFLSGGFDLAVIIYEDKTTQNWHEVVIEPDDRLLDESRRELEALNSAIVRKQLHDMLPECRALKGATWHDCGFGAATRTCPRAGRWPRLKP